MRDRLRDSRDVLARIGAFARKEVFVVIRQPRLVLTLILGPFLILALFGVGYRQQSSPLATLFVVDDDTPFASELRQRAADFDDDIEIVGTVPGERDAATWLRSGRADVAVVVPDQPIETIRNGERATFVVLHDKLDPFERATISLVARSTVDLVNRRILEELVASGQAESEELETLLPAARESARAMRTALEAGNTEEAAAHRRTLASQLRRIQNQTGSTEVLVENIRDDFSTEERAEGPGAQLARLAADLDAIDPAPVGEPIDTQVEDAMRLEADIESLSDSLHDFRRVPPEILVSPFGAQTEVVDAIELDITSFYAPGVIALLIQHIGITFAGLSLVRERALGMPEVFRVSPVHPAQILAGKYLGYLFAIAVVGGALSALMFGAFGVPLLGSAWSFLLVLVLLAFASLGLGFLISSLVTSDTQAVNLSLIVLLLSIFFSGFFLSLDRLVDWVRGVSWALPITHAIEALRDVMFRGAPVATPTLIALGGGSVALFIAALVLFRWRLGAE